MSTDGRTKKLQYSSVYNVPVGRRSVVGRLQRQRQLAQPAESGAGSAENLTDLHTRGVRVCALVNRP